MLNHGYRVRQIARAVRALVIKLPPNKLLIFFAIYFDWPVLADPATQFVEKHADQLVRDVRFRPPRCRAQPRSWIFHHFSAPSSQLTSTPSTFARAFSS